MATTTIRGSTFDSTLDPDLYLTPTEQELLLSALTSNSPATKNSNRSHPSTAMAPIRSSTNRSSSNPNPNQAVGTNPSKAIDVYASPIQPTPGSASFGGLGFDQSPFLDYDLDDGNFDWDTNEQMIGSLPGTSLNDDDEDNELHDKRKNPDDDQEDAEGGGKRRESDDRSSKRPGRKPLTSEPTSKRKAQNRAAQRAFRERKERHLKELETKVEGLEKASDSANHENGLLRAQVDRLQNELKEYRKRLSLNGNGMNRSPPLQSLSSRSNWDINNNFQFEFPKFGGSSGVGTMAKANLPRQISNGVSANNSPSNKENAVSFKSPKNATSPSRSLSQSNSANFNNGMDEFAGLFSPSILEGVGRSNSTDYMSYKSTSNGNVGGNAHLYRANTTGAVSDCTTASPSASSFSQAGPNSSCETSPEPSATSPGVRKESEGLVGMAQDDGARRGSEGEKAFCELLSTACGTKDNPVPLTMAQSGQVQTDFGCHGNEETPDTTIIAPVEDFHGIDWMAQQNGGSFDPVLFGDYRDPQENIMSGDFGGFFNDAFPALDFGTPSNTMLEPTLPPKKDIIQEIEEQQAGKEPEVVPGERHQQFLTCNMLWDRVQRSEKVQSGEADMDDLCSQLKSKAKCSGSGAVIDQKDVDAILGPAHKEQYDFLKMFK